MTYSYIHRMINHDAFPKAIELYDSNLMTVRGRGKYTYKQDVRKEAEIFFRDLFHKFFPSNKIVYFS